MLSLATKVQTVTHRHVSTRQASSRISITFRKAKKEKSISVFEVKIQECQILSFDHNFTTTFEFYCCFTHKIEVGDRKESLFNFLLYDVITWDCGFY